jgi:signal transduction histidine kinase
MFEGASLFQSEAETDPPLIPKTGPLDPASAVFSARHQRRWLTAALAVLILVGFAYTVSVPHMAMMAIGVVRGTVVAGVVFVGILVVFSLYVFSKHDELERLRILDERRRGESERLRYRLAEVTGLFDAAITLSVHPDLGRVLEFVCRRIVVALDASIAAVLLRNPNDGTLEVKACDGALIANLVDLRVREGEGAIGGALAYGRPAVLCAPELAQGSPVEQPLAAVGLLIVLPVRIKTTLLGALIVSGRESLADPQGVAALALFAESLGTAIARIERQREAESRTFKLEDANRELSEHRHNAEVFLATATHELRTPLSGIVSYAEVLADYYDTLSDQERRALCVSLSQQCKAMTGLVDDLFDFVRLESGRLTLDAESTEAADLVSSAVNLMAPVAAERGLHLEQHIPDIGAVILDATKIRQCVLNLLSNAIKFTDPGGTIVVRVSAAAKGIEVSVTDTGRGVPPDEIDRIFTLFHSGAGRRAEKSLGLGLYLVKSFVELHGGEIWVTSEPDRGSSFGFSLPWIPPGYAAAGSGVGPHAAA